MTSPAYSDINPELERFKGYRQTSLLGRVTDLSPVAWWNEKPTAKIPPPPAPPLHNFVFGKRMEWYFRHEINYSSRYELLVENLQIQKQGTTLGELDFILHDHSQQRLVHVEMAFKFYLYDPSLPAEISRWVGPNRRDTLDLKLKKLRNRQFPLLFSPETESALENYDLPDLPVHQKLYFKAQLFIPLNFNHSLPLVNPAAVSGFWLSLKNFKSFSKNQFYLPAKRDWIINPAVWTDWKSFDETFPILQSLAAQNQSPMVWMKSDDGYQKMFVVWW